MLCKGRLSKWGIGKFAGFNDNLFYEQERESPRF